MRIADLASQPCSVARGIGVVGDAWSLMLVRELFLGSRRHDELQAYTGMALPLLSQRLRALVAAGVIERRPYQERPTRFEYRLTPKGQDLWPVISALRAWGDRWGGWENGPPVRVTHQGCGAEVEVKIVCSACAAEVAPRQATVHLSAEAQARREALHAARPAAQARHRRNRNSAPLP